MQFLIWLSVLVLALVLVFYVYQGRPRGAEGPAGDFRRKVPEDLPRDGRYREELAEEVASDPVRSRLAGVSVFPGVVPGEPGDPDQPGHPDEGEDELPDGEFPDGEMPEGMLSQDHENGHPAASRPKEGH